MDTNTPRPKITVLDVYHWTVITAGAFVFLFTLPRVNFAELGYTYLLFGTVTVAFASSIVVPIPRTKGTISVSDTFVFLAMLLFGGEAAILLSTIDAIPPSLKISKTRITFLFNIAVFAISTSVTVWLLRSIFGSIPIMTTGAISPDYVEAVCLMGLFQYIVNSGLVAIVVALRVKKPIWRMWRENFLWTSITYFAGASAAGIIAKVVGLLGIYAFLAALPIVAVVYFTYTTYLKNVETAAKAAEQAQEHVSELSHHIAEQARISQALQESEEYFRSAFDHAAGMAVISPQGKWVQVNASLCKMLGFTESELLSDDIQSVTHPDDLSDDMAKFDQLIADQIHNYQLEKRFIGKGRNVVWVLQSASLIRDVQGLPRHVVLQIQDISDRKSAEDLIRHAAFHDALTGLPNRTLFADRLSMAIERAKRTSDFRFAVIFLDLDRFKVLNDSLGHDCGDQLLIDLARRLENCIRTIDTVARLGGDEFVILLDGISSIADATMIAERIQKSLKEPFDFDGQKFFTTASMGIASSAQGYDRPEDILRDADTAMYKAKTAGKARHELFDVQMHTRALQALTVENELRNALDHGEIRPYYQPIVSLVSGEIVGFEALARWFHPERGLISPADFIPLAEDSGLIVPIGQLILNQACEQTAEWQRRFDRPELSISVNLSTKQFRQSNLISEVKKVIRRSGIGSGTLKLEITESMVIEDLVAAAEMLLQFQKLDIQISIDDFGTGYSSLSYLHRFTFDYLKIDRSFITRMTKDKESLGIVKTISTLAKELSKAVIAEGVETIQQRRILSLIGCQYAQGFLFSRAVNADEAGGLIDAGQDWVDVGHHSLSNFHIPSRTIEASQEM